MHERNVHTVTVFAGMCVTGLECKTIFLHCDIAAFFRVIFFFFAKGKRLKW